MNNAQKDIARLVVTRLYPFLDGIRERLVARFVTLHNLSALLIDYDDVIVLVNYLHTYIIKHKGRDVLSCPLLCIFSSTNDYMFMPPSTWMT